MGSIGTGTSKPTFTNDMQYYLKNASAEENPSKFDMNAAYADWIYDNVSDHVDYRGEEWEILWQNGRFVNVLEEPTPEHPDAIVTLTVDIGKEGTDKRVSGYTLKEINDPRKVRKFRIPVYR